MALTPPPSAPPAAPDAPGDAPQRTNPSTFSLLADAFVVWIVGFRDDLADLRSWLASYISWAGTNVDEMDALQSDVTVKAATATTKAAEAAASAQEAAGAAASSTVNRRGDWAPLTDYAIRDIARNSGIWYICVEPHTSAASFATDRDTKWRVYQGITTGDLSASSGASLVGFLADGSGSVARNLQDKGRDFVCVFDKMTQNQINNVRAGLGTVDVTAAVQAACDDVAPSNTGYDVRNTIRGGTIYFPAGRYRITGQIAITAGTRLVGDGPNTTILVNESTSGDVIYALGVDSGQIDPVSIEEMAIAQKTGVAHSSGYAIKIDGNNFGTTPRLRNVYTYGTYGGVYLDWCFPGELQNVHAFAHTIEGFVTRFNCTSLTFQNCYAGANGGSGFKISGNYTSLVNCASDSNTLDGYEIYYDGGAATGISLVSCGGELNARDGISEDRVGSLSVIAPRIIMPAAAQSALKFDGGDAITLVSPVLSAVAANANPCINISNASGAYPSNVHILGWSGQPTNYATPINQPDYVTWAGSRTAMGMYNGTLRLGGIGAFTRDLQIFQLGNNFPAGSGGTAYAENIVPVVTQSMTTVASRHYRPVVNAPAGTIGRMVAGGIVEAPTVTAGTVTRHEGYRIDDQPAGSTADANLVLGSATISPGRWSLFNVSTRDNLFGGSIQWGSVTGPKSLFGTGTPEGAVTAVVGSTFRRTDGGAGTSFYVKESGSGNTGWVAK